MEPIVISTTQFIQGLISVSAVSGIFLGILSLWIKTRLEQSIQHEYSKKIEDYKFSQLQRQKAELIARLFARWIKYSGKTSSFLDKKELIEYYEELNRMSLEISIWVKDEKLLTEIMARFQLKDDSPDIRELIGRVRKMVLDDNSDNFDPQKIVTWPNSEEYKTLFG